MSDIDDLTLETYLDRIDYEASRDSKVLALLSPDISRYEWFKFTKLLREVPDAHTHTSDLINRAMLLLKLAHGDTYADISHKTDSSIKKFEQLAKEYKNREKILKEKEERLAQTAFVFQQSIISLRRELDHAYTTVIESIDKIINNSNSPQLCEHHDELINFLALHNIHPKYSGWLGRLWRMDACQAYLLTNFKDWFTRIFKENKWYEVDGFVEFARITHPNPDVFNPLYDSFKNDHQQYKEALEDQP